MFFKDQENLNSAADFAFPWPFVKDGVPNFFQMTFST